MMLGMVLLLALPAYAQEEFDVFCVGQEDCQGSGGEAFICEPLLQVLGEATGCTSQDTGETFDCVVEDFFEVFTTLRCETPATPPEGGGTSGGGGGNDGGGGAGGGGAAAPITQEGDQVSEAGEIDQTFDVSHQS